MKPELIVELFQTFEEACYLYNDIEWWSARDLQEVLGYTEWRNFKNARCAQPETCNLQPAT
ncbi:MAG: hypothetical protein DYG85_16140 [Chloroflexi bacterium CFX1]|nr:hypothetical protein [Chloroflexi bacterium CFX1]MCQ3954844.1 hypothetical protein [Chloroflexota bacterium]MDL1919602.1 hypothetical protein [Chloroflexi bacterium CFX5]